MHHEMENLLQNYINQKKKQKGLTSVNSKKFDDVVPESHYIKIMLPHSGNKL
jgi:hypothetical protein